MTSRANLINFATGSQSYPDPFFELRGSIAVRVGSTYHSDENGSGAFGIGRLSELDAVMTLTDQGRLRLVDEDCFSVFFDRPALNIALPVPCGTARRLSLSVADRGAYLVKDGRLSYRFDKYPDRVWRLTQIGDRNGVAVHFNRSLAGRLEELVTPEHLRVEFRYDAAGLRTSARLFGMDGSFRDIMHWAYDEAGRMVRAEAVFGQEARYGYNRKNRLVSASLSNGCASICDYDDQDRVVAIRTNSLEDSDIFEYDEENRVTTYLPGGDRAKARKFIKDAKADIIIREENGWGGQRKTEFASNGNVLAETDGAGNRTSYIHDEEGNVAERCDPEGRKIKFCWDQDRNLTSLTDGEGGSWAYFRDERGNIVAIQDALGFRTDIVNSQAGQPIATMRHDGLIERRTYDDNLRLTQIIDFRGGRTFFEHDVFGRVVAITDATGATTRLAYEDAPGSHFWSPSHVTRPDGVVLTATASDRGNSLVVTDGEGRTRAFRKGACGLLSEIEGPTGAKVRFFYDRLERLERLVNQNGQSWTFEHDAAGRVVRERDVEGLVVEYAYDRADRRIETRFIDGTRIAHGYDRSGLLVREELYEPERAEPRVTIFRYDGRGMLASARNDDASVTFERDKIGRVVAETVNGQRIESTFDCCGNRTARRIGGSLVEYSYDPLGALQSLTVVGHDPLVFTRDLMGRELGRRHSRGFRFEQQWDQVGQLIRQHAPDTAASHTAGQLSNGVDRTYEWTRASMPRAIADSGWGTTRYEHDANGQVVLAKFGDGGTERYAYDAALNLVGGNPPSSDTAALSRSPLPWSTTPSGRILTARGPGGEEVMLTHDVRGRIATRSVVRRGFRPQTWRYRWDGRDRMVGCLAPDGARWSYGYDPFGRRVSKARRDRPSGDGPVGTSYLWDGNVVATAAPIMADGTVASARAVTWHWEPGFQVPLVREEGANLHYVTADHLGTPRELFDETGTVVWAREHSLWGAPRRTDASSHNGTMPESQNANLHAKDRRAATLAPDADPCPIVFQGQWADGETGLYYNRYRYYDPLAASYTSPDPIGLAGGPATSNYVENPLIFVDPLGLASQVPYNSTDLSQAVLGQRKADGVSNPNRNYAAFRIRCKDGTSRVACASNIPKAGSPDSLGLHSEYVVPLPSAGNLQPGEVVTDIYSERIPCSTCSQMIGAGYPGANVTYSFSGDNKTQNLASALNSSYPSAQAKNCSER